MGAKEKHFQEKVRPVRAEVATRMHQQIVEGNL